MKLTILLPYLNEEKTIKETIVEIKEELKRLKILSKSEILVVDNNSTDSSSTIAKKLGARVILEKQKGYGAALKTGIKQAKGKYVIFGDCDRSYHFTNLDLFLNKLENGTDIVIGNRFKGKMQKDVMPKLHKYFGTILYRVPVSDFNSGLRGLNKDKILDLNLKSDGMEFASEMLIKAQKAHLIIEEIPIDFYKDKKTEKPHLNTFKDGFRHLKTLLVNIDSKYYLIFFMLLLFIFKLWFVSIQPISGNNAGHDDGMFVKEATSILNGEWLGEYNDVTLSKGVVGIIFIAFSYVIGINYLLAEQILYFFAVISIICMLKHIINKKWILFIIYAILLLNPISYSNAFSFVYRDGIYTSFILFLIAFSFQIFFHYKDSLWKLILNLLGFGFTFSCIYLCREETMWLAPFLIIALIIICCFLIFDKEVKSKIIRLICIILFPSLILAYFICLISYTNYTYYGRFITNDFTSSDFKAAYGAVTRIKQKNYIKRVPLNEETRYILYDLSPAFKELEEYLESEEAEIHKSQDHTHDFQEGFLYWAMRIAALKAGYYQNAQTSKEYWNRLANEINELCDNGQLDCYAKRSSLVAPFQKELIEECLIYIPKAFSVQLTYENVYVEIPYRKNVSDFEQITGNKSSYEEGDLTSQQMYIMKFILKCFQIINPYLMLVSILCYIFLLIGFFSKKTRFKNYKEIILLSGILCIYITRCFTVGYVAATEYTSAVSKCQYLASAYPVQSLFCILTIIFTVLAFTKSNKIKMLKQYKNN